MADARADLFIRGDGSFTKDNDLVETDMGEDSTLFLRVRNHGEPESLSWGIAQGLVASEVNLVRTGDVAEQEAICYDDVTVSAISLSDEGAKFVVDGESDTRVFSFSVPDIDTKDLRVEVDGKKVKEASGILALEKGGDRPLYILHEYDGGVYALVYLPSMSTHIINIATGISSSPAFTIATILAAAAGVVMVTTATVYLFRK